jgi:hypothetical protein
MQRRRIYLLHPQDKFLPVVSDWVSEAREILQDDGQWVEWDLCVTIYSRENSFKFQDVLSQVRQTVGPLVLIQPVQTKPRELLRRALRSQTIVLTESVSDSTDIYRVLDEARRRFESGNHTYPANTWLRCLLSESLRLGITGAATRSVTCTLTTWQGDEAFRSNSPTSHFRWRMICYRTNYS